ncbi:MAG: hypothetical protein IT192_06770 [Microbacteriaceae bacterium]|nr:hypothetical protein [Microbacteriaceae bacterium]
MTEASARRSGRTAGARGRASTRVAKRSVAAEVAGEAAAGAAEQHGRATGQQELSAAEQRKVAEAIQAIREGREQRALGEWKIRQGIHDLDVAGWSQRKISRLAGISQPEVSRRLKRRSLEAGRVDPRELIMQRATGQITTEEMVEGLQKLRRIGRAPTRASAFDSAASVTGNARKLASAFREGLLSEEEYEALRKQFDRRDQRDPSDRRESRQTGDRADTREDLRGELRNSPKPSRSN